MYLIISTEFVSVEQTADIETAKEYATWAATYLVIDVASMRYLNTDGSLGEQVATCTE